MVVWRCVCCVVVVCWCASSQIVPGVPVCLGLEKCITLNCSCVIFSDTCNFFLLVHSCCIFFSVSLLLSFSLYLSPVTPCCRLGLFMVCKCSSPPPPSVSRSLSLPGGLRGLPEALSLSMRASLPLSLSYTNTHTHSRTHTNTHTD